MADLELTYEKKTVYERCDKAIIDAAYEYAIGYKAYLDAAKTERESVTEGIRLAKENGSKAFAYWNSTDLVTSGGYDGAVSLEIAGVSGYVHLVDPMDGSVYEIGNDIMNDKGGGLYVFEHLPVKDYPLILTFGDFIN